MSGQVSANERSGHDSAGAFITLTQTLGGSFTVIINGNMARIAGVDADAIGLTVEPLTFEPGEKLMRLILTTFGTPCVRFMTLKSQST